MSVDAQKLELITWITGLNDKGLLDQLYVQVKKTLESQRTENLAAPAIGTDFNDRPPLPSSDSALQLLEQITDAYVALDEPDLNTVQIFMDRTKANGRKIDFN